MRLWLLCIYVIWLAACDALFGPYKQSTLSCPTEAADCMGPTACVLGGSSCTSLDGGVVTDVCPGTACATPGCWESICLASLTGQDLTALWVGSSSTIWATSKQGKIFAITKTANEPTSALEEPLSTSVLPHELNGIYGTSSADIWAVGSGGTVLHRGPDLRWTSPGSVISVDLLGVSGTIPSNYWAIGTGGRLLRYDGNSWGLKSGFQNALYSVWASPNGDAFIVGDSGTVLRYTMSGPQSDQTSILLPLNHVFGTAQNDVWAAGGTASSAIILHYDGSNWTVMLEDPGPGFRGVWGDGVSSWFVGYGGRILRMSGGTAVSEPTSTSVELSAVSGNVNLGIWAVGKNGTLLRRRP